MTLKINITGGIFGIDGYSSHTKGLINGLHKVADCRLITQLPQGWEKVVNDAELEMITKPEFIEDWNIIVTIPHMWKLYTGLGKNIGYCVWEGDKVPVSWIDDFMNPKIDMIFVPSEHTKQAILNTLKQIVKEIGIKESENVEYISHTTIKNKIKVIPHGVNREIFHSRHSKDNMEVHQSIKTGDLKDSENLPVDAFKFICNKGWRGSDWDRGGVQYVIKAFAEEFNKGDKVQLIVKLNPSYININQIKQSVDNLNLPVDRAPIHINCDNIPFNKLVELYNQADCYICATRSEAFNLPGLEAMSCGLPTIQTNFGGQTDYMKVCSDLVQGNSLFIDYELEEVTQDSMYEGISWAVPNIEDLKKQLRWAFENQDKIKQMGEHAEQDSRSYTWDNSAKKIIEILK